MGRLLRCYEYKGFYQGYDIKVYARGVYGLKLRAEGWGLGV